MTIDETIDTASAKYGVLRASITRGGRVKTAAVVRAREWIIARHPEMGAGELSRALGFRDHSGILAIRKRIASTAITD